MRNDYNQEVEGSKSLMVFLANVIEARDFYTDGHTRRVSMIATSLGRAFDLPKIDIETLELVGMIHDIGKVSISDNILNKQGRLTDEEFLEIKSHPVIGEKICRSLNALEPTLAPVGILMDLKVMRLTLLQG